MYRPINFQQLNCVNHPEKASVENCEVCNTPLCNFCLYYTSEGQRLCERHAQEAKANGKVVYSPETYSDGVVSAQVRATENRIAEFKDFTSMPLKPTVKGAISGKLVKYHANNHDLMGFIGLMAGFYFVLGIISFGFCVPIIGTFASIAAIINANDAVDKRRTRTQGCMGLVLSGTLLLGLAGIVASCYASTIAVRNNYNYNYNNYGVTPYIGGTSTIRTSTPVPTRTRAPIQQRQPTDVPTLTDVPTTHTLPAIITIVPNQPTDVPPTASSQ